MFTESWLRYVASLIAAAAALYISAASIFMPTGIAFDSFAVPANDAQQASWQVQTPDPAQNISATQNVSAAVTVHTTPATPPVAPTETTPTLKCYTCPVELMPAEGDYYLGCTSCYPTCPPCSYSTVNGKKLMMCPMIACRALDGSSQL